MALFSKKHYIYIILTLQKVLSYDYGNTFAGQPGLLMAFYYDHGPRTKVFFRTVRSEEKAEKSVLSPFNFNITVIFSDTKNLDH